MTRNRITEQLNIRYPIIEGGMAHIGDGRLAAAVSNAGGLGQIAVSGFSPRHFRDQIEIAESQTGGPIGVNIPLGINNYEKYFDVIESKKESLAAVSLSSGDPRPHIPRFKEMGLTVMVVVASVRHAVNAEKSGADIIICEGFEAGGRNSYHELTLFSLIPSIAERISIPLVAAGGISNGKTMLGAMALGAEGVQVGTRFIASHESPAHESYKQALVEASETATTVMERSIGSVNRVLANRFVEEVQQLEKKNIPFPELFTYINGQRNRVAALDGKMEHGWVHAGQGTAFIQSVASAEQIVQELVDEMDSEFGHFQNRMKNMREKDTVKGGS